MNAISIIYPQFWFQLKVENIFFAQLGILKVHYCHGRNIGPNQVFVPPLLDEVKLNEQTSFFKMTTMFIAVVAMKSPTNCNLCSKMWTLLTSNQIISHKLLERLKFIELFMAMVLGSVEDERCFSTLSFTKSKLRNRFAKHLDSILHMYAPKKIIFWKISHFLQ